MSALTDELSNAVIWLRGGADELTRIRQIALANQPVGPGHDLTKFSDFHERQMRLQADKLALILVGLRAAQKGLD